jgi:hypothetical protein
MTREEKHTGTLPCSMTVRLISCLAATVLLSAGCSSDSHNANSMTTECSRMTSIQIEAETQKVYAVGNQPSENARNNCINSESNKEHSGKITRYRKSFSVGKVPQEKDYVNVLTGFRSRSRSRLCTRYTGCAGRIRTEENNPQKWIK